MKHLETYLTKRQLREQLADLTFSYMEVKRRESETLDRAINAERIKREYAEKMVRDGFRLDEYQQKCGAQQQMLAEKAALLTQAINHAKTLGALVRVLQDDVTGYCQIISQQHVRIGEMQQALNDLEESELSYEDPRSCKVWSDVDDANR